MATGNPALSGLLKNAALANLKFGKTKDQKKVIDFFMLDDNGCGCLGKSPMKLPAYEKMVFDRCNALNIKQRALARIGLDESMISEINPITLHSYVYTLDEILKNKILIKITDGVAVTSKYEVTWLFFSSEQIFAYSIEFDMISDEIFEDVQEFFYTDITCFETANHLVENIKPDTSGCLGKEKTSGTRINEGCMRYAIKNNYVVDSLHIVVPGKDYTVSMRNSGNQFQSVQAAKAMLREKKYSK